MDNSVNPPTGTASGKTFTAAWDAIHSLPHLEQYAGIWATYEPEFLAAIERVRATDLAAHIAVQQARHDPTRIEPPLFERVDGSVAVIDMVGVFTKYGSSFSSNPGALQLRRAVRTAVADTTIKAIVLKIDSPGGSTAGLDDLAAEVARAAKVKPVVAFIEDLGASAAYYVASQATRIVANAGAIVGAIGTYTVLRDWSALFAREGVKVHVVKSGEFKAIGERGTEITGEQLAETQRLVDQFHNLFVAAVARGRGMSIAQVRELADGRVHVGSEAMKLGFVDAIGGFEETVAGVGDRGSGVRDRGSGVRGQGSGRPRPPTPDPPVNQKENAMTDQTQVAGTTTEVRSSPPPATIAELKKGFPESTADWREKMLLGAVSMEDAKDFWILELDEKSAAQAQEIEQLKAKQGKSGLEPVGTGNIAGGSGSGDGDAVQSFSAAVRERMKDGMERKRAVRAVVHANPELHAEYIRATNDPSVHRLIDQCRTVG